MPADRRAGGPQGADYEARKEAHLRSADVQRRLREMRSSGSSPMSAAGPSSEIRERWPSYFGTRPKPKERRMQHEVKMAVTQKVPEDRGCTEAVYMSKE